MNFNEEEEQQLEYWVTTQLQSIKQRNPEVLAKLIVSLVKEDKSFDELKAYCITELKAFLKSQTEDFVCVLLEALTDGSYKVFFEEDNENDDECEEQDGRSRGRRMTADSPAQFDDEDERRPRGRDRYSRDSSDSFDIQSNPPSASKMDNLIRDTGYTVNRSVAQLHEQSTRGIANIYNNKGNDQHASYSNQQHTQFARGANHNQQGRGFQGRGNSQAQWQHHEDRRQPAAHQQQGPPSGSRINDSASYNPYANMTFGFMNSTPATDPATLGMYPQNRWMPGMSQAAAPGGDKMYPNVLIGNDPAAVAKGPVPTGGFYTPASIEHTGGAGVFSNSQTSAAVPTASMNSPVGARQPGRNASYEDDLMRDHAKALQHAPPPAPAVPVPVPAFPSMSTGVRPPPPSGPAPFPLAPMPVLQQQGGYQPYGAAVDGAPPPPPAAPYGYPMGAGGGGVGDGGYHPYAPYGAAIQAPQADSYGAQVQHSAATGGYQNRSYHGHGQGQGGYQQHQHSQLPEHERCTLKVWGIPSYVTEEDLRRHFELFGHVVELQLTPMAPRGGGSAAAAEGGAETDKKNVYFECLVQYYSAANAKKRLGAQDSVLNNRFIKFRASPFNIVPPADVPPPSADILHRDEQIVLGNISTTAAAVGPAQSRKKPAPTGFNMYAAGASNKYRRGADDDNNRVPSGVPADSDTGAGEGGVGSSSSPAGGAVGASAVPAPVAAPALTQEKYEMKQKFEQLKTLRQQAEEIAKKKEEILLAQVEKCRQMIDQLEQSEESESKLSLLQNLEAKILALQTQLRTLRDQNAARNAEASQSQSHPNSSHQQAYQGGYQGYQGYQQGYQQQGYPYAGRGRGRGRFPSGRGFVRGGRGGRFFRGGRAGGRGGRFGGRNSYYDASADNGEGGEGDESGGGEDGSSSAEGYSGESGGGGYAQQQDSTGYDDGGDYYESAEGNTE